MPPGLRILSPLRLPFRQAGVWRDFIPMRGAARCPARGGSGSRWLRACGRRCGRRASRSPARSTGGRREAARSSNTSSAAWPRWPDSSAAIIAASSTTAPRAVLTRIAPLRMRAMRGASRKPRVSSVSSRWIESTWLSASRRVEPDELDARRLFRRAVPGEHAHAAAMGDARDLRGDAAEAEQADRLAGELHAFAADPLSVADAAIHGGDAARGGPHQGDRVLGDGGVAIALDGVHRDAECRELLGVHVAARAGAEEDDVPQPAAAAHHLGGHEGVVVQHEILAGEQGGQLGGGDVGHLVHAAPAGPPARPPRGTPGPARRPRR